MGRAGVLYFHSKKSFLVNRLVLRPSQKDASLGHCLASVFIRCAVLCTLVGGAVYYITSRLPEVVSRSAYEYPEDCKSLDSLRGRYLRSSSGYLDSEDFLLVSFYHETSYLGRDWLRSLILSCDELLVRVIGFPDPGMQYVAVEYSCTLENQFYVMHYETTEFNFTDAADCDYWYFNEAGYFVRRSRVLCSFNISTDDVMRFSCENMTIVLDHPRAINMLAADMISQAFSKLTCLSSGRKSVIESLTLAVAMASFVLTATVAVCRPLFSLVEFTQEPVSAARRKLTRAIRVSPLVEEGAVEMGVRRDRDSSRTNLVGDLYDSDDESDVSGQ